MSVNELHPSRIIEMAGFPDPASITNAVVFIRAAWSIYSKASFTNLAEAVAKGLDDSWKVIVLNTDDLQFEEFKNVYGTFPSSGGWGEAFWIKSGILIHSDRGYYNEPLRKLLWRRIREFSTLEDLKIPEIPADNEFRRSVMKNCADFPVDQMAINDLDCIDIGDLHFAAVILYQVNRAQAVVALRALVKELQKVPNAKVKLIVINADAVAFSDMIRSFGEAPEAGKTYWVLNGQVTSKAQWLSAVNERRS